MAREALMMLKIRKYWWKKQLRTTRKKVRYNCRQNLAKQRFRHQGRFITKEEMEKLDPDQIYDPNVSYVPKVKQVFRISKEHHKGLTCRSAHGSSASMRHNSFHASDSLNNLSADMEERGLMNHQPVKVGGIGPFGQPGYFQLAA